MKIEIFRAEGYIVASSSKLEWDDRFMYQGEVVLSEAFWKQTFGTLPGWLDLTEIDLPTSLWTALKRVSDQALDELDSEALIAALDNGIAALSPLGSR